MKLNKIDTVNCPKILTREINFFMKTINICKASISDIKTINAFQYKLGVYERTFDNNLKDDANIKYYSNYMLKKHIKSEQSLCLIAKQNHEAIGFGVALLKQNKNWHKGLYKAYIDFLFIKEEYRNQGVGKTLMKKLIQWIKKKKVTDIRLQVFHNSSETLKFYRNMGFKDYIFEMGYKEE